MVRLKIMLDPSFVDQCSTHFEFGTKQNTLSCVCVEIAGQTFLLYFVYLHLNFAEN